MRDKGGFSPGFQFLVKRLITGVEQMEQFFIFAKDTGGPDDELADLIRHAVPQGENALIQLGGDHNDQHIDYKKTGGKAENYGHRIGKPLHIFGKNIGKKGFIGVAQGPQQIGDHTAVDKGCQNIRQCLQSGADTLHMEENEEQDQSHGNGGKDCQTHIQISSLFGINHSTTPFP